MEYYVSIMNSIMASKYYNIFYVILLVLIIFQGKISSLYVIKVMNKIFTSKYQLVNEVKCEFIDKNKLENLLNEYYNYYIKAHTYLTLVIASLPQAISLFMLEKIDRINLNIFMLTLVISVIEYRDNLRTAKEIDKKVDKEIHTQIEIFNELDVMVMEDRIKDFLKRN